MADKIKYIRIEVDKEFTNTKERLLIDYYPHSL